MSDKEINLGGRPVVHGLKAITNHRIRQARLAFASGKSRRKVSVEIFKLSPRTFSRYLELDDPKAKALKRAVGEGEGLKGEPLASFICMLIDKRDQLIEINKSTQHIDLRLKRALIENKELKEYLNADGRKKVKTKEKI